MVSLPALFCVILDGDLREEVTLELATLNPELYKNLLFDNSSRRIGSSDQVFRG